MDVLKNPAVILAVCETKSGGATEGERALASLCASLEARIAEVEGVKQFLGADAAERFHELLIKEKRLAEVVKAIENLPTHTTVVGSGMDAHIVKCLLVSDLFALAHAHEEEIDTHDGDEDERRRIEP